MSAVVEGIVVAHLKEEGGWGRWGGGGEINYLGRRNAYHGQLLYMILISTEDFIRPRREKIISTMYSIFATNNGGWPEHLVAKSHREEKFSTPPRGP